MSRWRPLAAILATLVAVEAAIIVGIVMPSLTVDEPETTTAEQAVSGGWQIDLSGAGPPRAPFTLAASSTPTIRPSPPPETRRCGPADLLGEFRYSQGAAGTGYFALYLTNTSSSICIIVGSPQISGVLDDGAEVEIRNVTICKTKSECDKRKSDTPFAIYPPSEIDRVLSHAALISLAIPGYEPQAERCANAPPPLAQLRVSWPGGVVDIPTHGLRLCYDALDMSWFQPSNPPHD